MNSSLEPIPLLNLMLGFLPALIVICIFYFWSLKGSTLIYATFRMLVQLLLVGHVLAIIFKSDRAAVVLFVLTVMLLAASWISLRPLKSKGKSVYLKAIASIGVGGLLTLILVTQVVLDLTPWYKPQFVIPLAGMIFANSMNALSLAAERFEAETAQQKSYSQARQVAFNAALIPLVNTLFAVGLVSFPGMMTGQILSGVTPLVAARYQIMVMSMIFGSAGISTACYLIFLRPPHAPAKLKNNVR